jgi:hypothetical protein
MSTKIRTVNDNLDIVTIQDIENHKLITNKELDADLKSLDKFTGDTNKNSFAGNRFLYHFQFKNLLKCRREDGKTIYDIWGNTELKQKLLESTKKRNRGGRTPGGNIFECFRINLGAVVMFKATTAKYLYKKYRAQAVLDPTAGWGGRMLAAHSLGIEYTGIDTNIEMKPAYDNMINYLSRDIEINPLLIIQANPNKLTMYWQSCLDVDFSTINYDFVLTSPPYINLEIYEHMEPWDNEKLFYLNFFIPLWQKCVDNIKKGGHVAFNISPKMYEDAVSFGLSPCDDEEDLLQQMGQKKGKKKQDKIYIWNC